MKDGMKIFITGGTGFVGTHLSKAYLDKSWQVAATGTSSAHPLSGTENFTYVNADTTQKGAWQDAARDADAIVNLAGRNIFNFWTEDYKKQIYDSRVLTTTNLVEALDADRQVTLLSASAVGVYGSRGEDLLTESTAPGDDFLAGVCKDWEAASRKAAEKGARVALMRFGIILGRGGGALAKMMPAFKFFVGGPLGNGMHWFPWMHIDDLTAATLFLLKTPDAAGAFNFCAPQAVRYKTFTRLLGQQLGRPSFVKTPAFLLKLIAGEMGAAMLSSQRAVPAQLEQAGFSFQYPELDKALKEIVA
jgi:uncharacterized protein (TIGR01777 family)